MDLNKKNKGLRDMEKKGRIVVLRRKNMFEEISFIEYEITMIKETEKKVKFRYKDGREGEILKRKLDAVLFEEQGAKGVDDFFYKVTTFEESKINAYKQKMIEFVKARIAETKKVVEKTELELNQLMKEM